MDNAQNLKPGPHRLKQLLMDANLDYWAVVRRTGLTYSGVGSILNGFSQGSPKMRRMFNDIADTLEDTLEHK